MGGKQGREGEQARQKRGKGNEGRGAEGEEEVEEVGCRSRGPRVQLCVNSLKLLSALSAKLSGSGEGI